MADVPNGGSVKRALLTSHVVLWLALALPTAAQIPKIPGSGDAKASAPETDPLGRSTPRGTIGAFIRAVHGGNLVSAASYMQVTAKQRPQAETLARDLNELMDRYFRQRLAAISDSPEGALDDGLPTDREKVGPLEIGEEKVDIGLIRVKERGGGEIWLISSETLEQVPSLLRTIEATWIERVMPEALLNYAVFGIPLAQLLAWAASIAIPFLLLALVSLVVIVLARRIIRDPTRRRLVDSWYAGTRWPGIVVLVLGIHLASFSVLGFSLISRILYSRIVTILLIVAFAWLIYRVLTLAFGYASSKMQGRELAGTRSLMLLGERVLKVLVVVVAFLLILTALGVPPDTALAGLGIGGIALAIGAQKTVENFLGGFFLLTDKALAVGDMCSISNRRGYVEDITLRSVRLRTLEQTLLSIPAGALSQDSIENFSTRGKMLAQNILRLRYGTSADQLRSILGGISGQLAENSRIEAGTFRVRLIDFGVRGIEIELFAYVLTSEIPEFLAVREELLLQIAEIVEAAGSAFARPEILEVGS